MTTNPPVSDRSGASTSARLLGYPGHQVLVPNVIRAENCTLHDARGKRYVDLESGVWCTPLGHAHPRILRVLAEQPGRIGHAGYCYSNPVVEEAAGEVLSATGLEGGACVFLCSGSEAVEYAVRTVQMLTTRPLLLTMTDSYFGAYGSANRRGTDEWISFDWSPCAGCARPAGDLGVASGGCPGCPAWEALPWDRIGGFLFEPGSSSGLVRFPPQALIRNIVRRVREEDGGWIAVNEVTTGMGRTGEWFGFRHYGFTPDAVALGKGLGNGYPVAAAAFSPRLREALGARTPAYSQSHQNDPLGAAVAREVIRTLRSEGLVERGREMASLLRAGLDELRRRDPRLREVRSRGLMIALEFEDLPEAPFTRGVFRALLDRGYIVAQRPGRNVIRVDPALTVERKDVEGFVTALGQVLADSNEYV